MEDEPCHSSSCCRQFLCDVVVDLQSNVPAPVHVREFIEQSWFIAGVSIMPALLMAIPFCMMFVYQINILLAEIGAVDLSGAAPVSPSSARSDRW